MRILRLAVFAGCFVAGCVSPKRHRAELELAYRAGQASAADKAVAAMRQADAIRARMRALCESEPRYRSVNDECVDLAGK